MSIAAAKLLSEFEGLRSEEKQEFVRELILRFPAWDSGPLDDRVAANAGNQIAAMLDQEERGSEAR